MKLMKKILSLMLISMFVLSSSLISFAGSKTKVDSNFFFNYSYYQYEDASGNYTWELKVPGKSSITISGNTTNALEFKDAIDEMDTYFDKYYDEAKPASSLKTSDPDRYEVLYAKFITMKKVVLLNMEELDYKTLRNSDKLLDEFDDYFYDHYSNLWATFTKSHDGVFEILKVAYAADDAINIYNDLN